LVALFFISRGDEDALAAEVRIEKMWDEASGEAPFEQEENSVKPFVPAPPPLAHLQEEE